MFIISLLIYQEGQPSLRICCSAGEFDLRIELLEVQSWAAAFDPRLVKNIKKPQISQPKKVDSIYPIYRKMAQNIRQGQ